jgi:hypothetical protein
LITRFGPLDLLATAGNQFLYEDLLPNSVRMRIGEDLEVQVLNLETLIELKEQLGQEKDLAVLPVLRQTLIERQRAGGS